MNSNSAIARLAVSAATYHIDKPYDYAIPDNLIGTAAPGMRAIVPFGAGNRKSEGVILSLATTSGHEKLKPIESIIDDAAILSEENLKLAIWMSDRFFCTVYDALRAMLPAGMGIKDGKIPNMDKTENVAVLCIDSEEADLLAKQKRARAPQQAAILELLAGAGRMSVKEICYFTGASIRSVKTLASIGALTLEEQEVFRRPTIISLHEPAPIILNEEQREVFERIKPMLSGNAPEAALLYGITGSGKTLVYMKLVEETIALGKTAIVLVPEIALTPQLMSAFTSYFGENVAVMHSALGVGERYDEWKRIRSGAVRVVVGTRSAVFAPVENLGLIVLDEEQEHTYKSENNPRYHARDVAKYRVSRSNALLLLSSATPSMESMYGAKTGKYRMFRIEKRYNDKELPRVIIADMKIDIKNGNGSSISSILRNEIERNLFNKEQTILFINRRGTNPTVACGECGYTYQCCRCSVSMTYHSASNRLLCHYCGYSISLPDICPECGGRLKFIGVGTQKVESDLREIFPNIGIIRMDADSISSVNSHAKLLSRFQKGDAEILLGTQMVTKGLDFENVTLVGVLSADTSLYMSDFRAYEKAFSLMTQVVGRSGRGEKSGRAVIQTLSPNHEVIALASKQDYDGFYEHEIEMRRARNIPPIRDLLSLTASGIDERAVLAACARIKAALNVYFSKDKNIDILGPAAARVPKVNNRYRYRLLINCENTKRIRDTIAHTIKSFSKDKQSRGVTVFADADPTE